MAHILVRDVPEDVVAALDAQAQQLGLSRSEYLRRALAQTANHATGSLTLQDLKQFEQAFADLTDDDTMARAWR